MHHNSKAGAIRHAQNSARKHQIVVSVLHMPLSGGYWVMRGHWSNSIYCALPYLT